MLALSLRVCRTALPAGEPSPFGSPRSPKDLVAAFFENVRSGKNLDSVGDYLAPNVVAHQICSEDPMPIERTAADYAGHLREMMEACDGFSMTVDQLLADGNLVYARWTQRGTYDIPDDDDVAVPTPITEFASAVYRVDAGKIVEYWIQVDRLGTQRQVQNV